jgi:UDP-2-acetamido-2-deoxy-ribo-hexuluronate aminotransferase
MRWIRAHGQDRRYHHAVIGVNSRLDTLQAAILLAKLEIFPDEIRSRGEIGARYSRLLANVTRTPVIESHNTSVYAQYTIEVAERGQVIEKLAARGIPTVVHYPMSLHQQPAFRGLGLPDHRFPQAEAAADRVLSLPMHPYLDEKTQDRIVGHLTEVLKGPYA